MSEAMSSPPVTVRSTESLHHAIETMLRFDIGRLPVVCPDDPSRLVGILSRRAVLEARRKLLDEDVLEPATLLPFRKGSLFAKTHRKEG